MRHGPAAVLGALMVIAAPLSICGQTPPPGGAPDVNPPAGAKRVLEAFAQGDQIYTCKEESGQYSWTFKAPEAKLSGKRGKPLGRHFASPSGPTWELTDKSAVTGKRIQSVDSPYKDAIPWLLLEVTEHSGNGRLTKVSYVQRVDTKGGRAPATGCDASHAEQELRVPYSAKYVFYKSKPTK